MPKITLTEQQKQRKKEYQKEWREKNKEKLAQYNHKQKVYQKAYYEENREKVLQKQKVYQKTNGAIKFKLKNCKEKDIIFSREFDIDEDYVILLLQKQNNTCENCKKAIKLEWTEPRDPLQFSINRIDNNLGHIKGNCNVLCWGCNDSLGREYTSQLFFNRGSITKRERNHKGKIYYSWRFDYTINGESQEKSFSCNRYGDEKAHQMCIDFQNEIFPQ